MKVWYVEVGFQYENSSIEGIFDTEEKANNCQEALRNKEDFEYDYVDVYEMEVK